MCDRSLDVVHGLPDQCRLVDVEAAGKALVQNHQVGNDKRPCIMYISHIFSVYNIMCILNYIYIYTYIHT